MSLLTLVLIIGGDGQNCVLNVLVLIHFCLVQALVEIRWIVVLVSNADADEFGH